jgi:23S rRNA pseudouridine2605 synthase
MTDTEEKGERIAKRLSRAGICSRREAERWIADGRVRVDGRKIDTPATLVTDASRIMVDGKPVAAPDRTRLWRYYKPPGQVCSTSDPEGRPTVFDNLPSDMPRVMSVGRLDINSEGLLLLTNDGELARRLELPSTGWTRRYRVRVFGNPDDQALAALANGVTVEGVRYGAIQARLDSARGDNSWLSVALQEGKNREIRRVMEHFGYRVNRLIRIGYGPFQLGKLVRGEVDEVSAKVVAEQTGGAATPRLRPKKPDRKPYKRPGQNKNADRRRNP